MGPRSFAAAVDLNDALLPGGSTAVSAYRQMRHCGAAGVMRSGTRRAPSKPPSEAPPPKGDGRPRQVLVAMRYLAEDSKRSLVFAVEGPESFLHPSAQAAIRQDLPTLAEREDVTLLTASRPDPLINHPPRSHLSLSLEMAASQPVRRTTRCWLRRRDCGPQRP